MNIKYIFMCSNCLYIKTLENLVAEKFYIISLTVLWLTGLSWVDSHLDLLFNQMSNGATIFWRLLSVQYGHLTCLPIFQLWFLLSWWLHSKKHPSKSSSQYVSKSCKSCYYLVSESSKYHLHPKSLVKQTPKSSLEWSII